MARRPIGKAGRNEGRKLLGTLLNNLAVAILLAGLLQPGLAFLRGGQAFSRGDVVAGFAFGAIGLILHG